VNDKQHGNKNGGPVSFGEFLKNVGHVGPAQKQNNGENQVLTIILGSLAALLFLTLTFMVLFGRPDVKGLLADNGAGATSGISSTSTVDSLSLSAKPQKSTASLTTEQVAAKILPCVVGIVQYQAGSINETGEGSGIIMSADGKIITNYHVIEGANRLEVVMQNGEKYQASVIGSDSRTDLAVVKISSGNLKYAQFGNSDQCKVGEQVIAVGNPSGLQLAGSVTQGIISALNRNVDVGNGPMNLIQTDAAINPGNSGGALVNMYGQVIGINSAKIAQAGYEGLGFSIPVKTAKSVIDSILKYGYVKGRVKFGLNCKEIDAMTAQVNGIPTGIYIDYVEPGSSADENGVLADDIITAVNGVAVVNTDSLIVQRDKHKPGDEITLTIYRRSSKKTLYIKVKLMEDKGAATAGDSGDW
jgi:serine protease Do